MLGDDGTTVVIHQKPDNHANIPARYTAPGRTAAAGADATTQATGDAGVGIMCGTLRTVPPAERYIDAIYGTVLGRSVEPGREVLLDGLPVAPQPIELRRGGNRQPRGSARS